MEEQNLNMTVHSRGFTLIEVLVSMVLVSMVTMIIALVLRISLNAWERGEDEGEKAQIYTALPSLLGKQMQAAVHTMSFQGASESDLPFYGEKNVFSFFTLFSPMGTPWQGLVKITYQYDDIDQVLEIYENRINVQEDIKEIKADDRPVSEIPGVSRFSVRFLTETELKESFKRRAFYFSDASFQEKWEERNKDLPAYIELDFALSDNKEAPIRKWLIKVGGRI